MLGWKSNLASPTDSPHIFNRTAHMLEISNFECIIPSVVHLLNHLSLITNDRFLSTTFIYGWLPLCLCQTSDHYSEILNTVKLPLGKTRLFRVNPRATVGRISFTILVRKSEKQWKLLSFCQEIFPTGGPTGNQTFFRGCSP